MQKIKFQLFLFFLIVLSANGVVNNYNVVSRFKLQQDRLKNQHMLRPIGHDWVIIPPFDLTLTVNKDLLDIIKDAKDATEQTGYANQVSAANTFLNKYINSEQIVELRDMINIPIFSFNMGDVKVKPSLRMGVDLGALFGIHSVNFDLTTAKAVLKKVTLENAPAGTTEAAIDAVINSLNLSSPTFASTLCTSLGIPSTNNLCSMQIPTIGASLLAKVDAKAGIDFEFEVEESFFGNLNLYGVHRTDVYQVVTPDTLILQGGKFVDIGNTQNSEIYAMTDVSLGVKQNIMPDHDIQIVASAEEIKLTTLKERDANTLAPTYGTDPLLRLHSTLLTEYFGFLKFAPMVGVHKRKDYDLSDGMYAGAELSAYVFGNRLGLLGRLIFDKEHITSTVRTKFWLMHLEYMLKSPHKSDIDGIKTSAIHSLNFRIFF